MATIAQRAESRRIALFHAMLAATVVLVAALLPGRSWQALPIVLLGAWLCLVSLLRFVALRTERTSAAPRSIPLQFSGSIGRFIIRPRGDGRHVQVLAGARVVAEAIASDEGDQLVLDPNEVPDSDVAAFGSAVGLAIEMAAVADEDRPIKRNVPGPPRWASTRRARGRSDPLDQSGG